MSLRLLNEGFLFAFKSVVVNKLRTFLSLFGITIGIFCIMGSNVVYVQKFPWSFNGKLAWWDIIKWPSVSLSDYQSVLNKSTKAEAASFIIAKSDKVKYKNNVANDAAVAAVTDNLEKVVLFEIGKGRYFSPYEYSSGSSVAVLGAEVAERLFEKADPVGKEVTMSGYKARVIGVLKKEGQGGISLSNVDQLTLIPLNFGRNFINIRNRFVDSQMIIKAKPDISVRELSDELTMVLRASRRLNPTETSNFSVNTATMISQGLESVFKVINIVGWIIGAFAILVGGFGIANIMFVSVRERTNIIGIQKALGAKRFFILQQFLTESVLLSVAGGVLGLIMIFLATLVINYLYDLNMYLTFGNIILAVFISAVIGIVAGYAPASAAAKMNPVDAIGFSF
jgi:putative ABC transport system permease protein